MLLLTLLRAGKVGLEGVESRELQTDWVSQDNGLRKVPRYRLKILCQIWIQSQSDIVRTLSHQPYNFQETKFYGLCKSRLSKILAGGLSRQIPAPSMRQYVTPQQPQQSPQPPIQCIAHAPAHVSQSRSSPSGNLYHVPRLPDSISNSC